MDWVSKTRRKEAVVELMRAGDWRAVLEEFRADEKYREPLLVWIRPSLACLEFIRRELQQLQLSSVSSVGQGGALSLVQIPDPSRPEKADLLILTSSHL